MMNILSIVCLASSLFYPSIFGALDEACHAPEHPDDVATLLVKQMHSEVNAAVCLLSDPRQYPRHYDPKQGEEFDFIIVGAGSAGSVIANRLAQHEKNWKVLLIEAGGDPPLSSHVPGLYGTLERTEVDWQYKSESGEDNCLGMVNKRCLFPRGKMLGGSSSMSANLYVRGNRKDYDDWAAAGNKGWDYESVLEYFQKSENLRAREVLAMNGHENYHGGNGHLYVDTWEESGMEDLVGAFGNGMRELGYERNNDLNGAVQTGFVKFQGTIREGKTCNAANGFLTPVKDLRNLKVAKNSLVTQILLDKSTKTAHGVKLINKGGEEISVVAKNEVIVSAGAINTPQLLMLSGIGPKAHLEKIGIEVVQDLPVGENLYDDMLFVGLVLSHNVTTPATPLSHQMYDFLVTGSSKLSSVGLLSYGSFINTLDSSSSQPDIQVHHYGLDANGEFVVNKINSDLGLKDEIGKQFRDINSNRFMTYIMSALLYPESKGKILLQSKDPKAHPKIICGYFKDNEKDLDTFVRAWDFVKGFAETKGMKKIDTKFHVITPPECEQHDESSREFKVCVIKHLTTTTYHPTSTCRMGPDGDLNSVVNPELQVKGVKQLRVADASVIPIPIAGPTNAATIMIAEKASDLIINHALKLK